MSHSVRSLQNHGWRILCATLMLVAARTGQCQDLADAEESAIREAVQSASPSVVRIEVVGGLERNGPDSIGQGPTTGLIVGEEGWIISSKFAFEDHADSILVTLADGRRSGARLVATDQNRRIVLLKIQVDGKLPTALVVPASEIRVGQTAIALGRTFDPSQTNVSLGIVSAVNRVWGKAVQTDAKISPNNYGGPLVDIQGRVLGLLTPLSSDGGNEAVGAEYYDSGIGFAVPLEHIQQVLPRLKSGQDLLPGVIGVSLKGADPHMSPAIVAACPPNSPAYAAGVRAGDEIVEASGKRVTRQAELRYQIAPRYAGDRLSLVVQRDGQRLPLEIDLVDKLPPYDRPFLGILPMRGIAERGVHVRYVFADSPAAAAGVMPGDLLVMIDGKNVENRAQLADKLAEYLPGQSVELQLLRGQETIKIITALGRAMETVPSELPPAQPAVELEAVDPATTGRIDIKLPEFENKCVAFVPSNYRPKLSYGLVVWLAPPGQLNLEELFARWRAICESRDLILVVPNPQDATRWQPREAMVVRRVIERMKKSHSIDDTRIVTHGAQAGGAMAYYVGLAAARNVVRGIAVIDAALPADIAPPPADANSRLFVFSAIQSASGNLAARITAGAASLREKRHPVVERQLVKNATVATGFAEDELEELSRWIDSLDRL